MRPISLAPRKRVPGRPLEAAIVLALLLVLPALARAHPLGNFSVNRYARIEVQKDLLAVRYVVDMAEIPTFQEFQENGITARDGPRLSSYLSGKVEELKKGLALTVDGARVGLSTDWQEVSFPPGVGGLPTMKIGARFSARLDPSRLPARSAVLYRDTNFPGRAGWKEVVVVGASPVALQSSSAPTIGRSQELSVYPTNMLKSPPQELEARFVFSIDGVESVVDQASAPGGPEEPMAPRPGRLTGPLEGSVRAIGSHSRSRGGSKRDLALMRLMTARELGPGVMLLSLILSLTLGAMHALEPGHGKTIVGAYLVGSRGTARHALLLGLVVTATHTAGVYLLGLVTLYLSKHLLAERLYPWLGCLSGIAIVALGLVVFSRHYRRAFGGAATRGRPHDHRHDHHEQGDGQPHPYGDQKPVAVAYRELLALGITGGIIPCPAALVVLLSAVSLGRTGFGLLLIAAFSAGLALVLMGIGLLMVYARQRMGKFAGGGPLVTRWLPLTSAAVITLFGATLAVQAFLTTGLI